MANTRIMPPADGLHPSITVNGRTYTCAAGSTIDVPDFDAAVILHNGWTASAAGGVGTTTQRPTAPAKGQEFLDTTVGATLVWDGKVWRHHVTGASS